MAIHIDTIYESEAFQLLAQGMKDRNAFGIAYILMSVDEQRFRMFNDWCAEALKEQADEKAEWDARIKEGVDVLVASERSAFAEDRAAWEAERSKQYKIGDITNEMVFKPHGMKNLSDLQRVFDIVEKLLGDNALALATERHEHRITAKEFEKQEIHNKEAIARRDDRIERLKEEMAVIDAQLMAAKSEIALLKKAAADSESGDGGTITSHVYVHRMSKVHERLFGDDPTDLCERRDRHAEEGIELAQALGMSKAEFVKLLDYVYSKEAGNIETEIADSFTTLVSLGLELNVNVFNLGLRGLRNLEKDKTVDRIRAKRKTRHGRGPLPGLNPVKEPTNIGEVMRSRDFSTGAPKHGGKLTNMLAQSYGVRSIIGDNDGPWEVPATKVSSDNQIYTLHKPDGFRWDMHQPVRKKSGSSWRGHVCGFYGTPLTGEGYAVMSYYEPGNVQVYPVAALEVWDNGRD